MRHLQLCKINLQKITTPSIYNQKIICWIHSSASIYRGARLLFFATISMSMSFQVIFFKKKFIST